VRIPNGPKCEDPTDLCADLRIVQLSGEGMIGATGAWVDPHCHRPQSEWLNAAIDKGLHPSTRLGAVTEQHREGVVACGHPDLPHRIPSWAERWDSYP
jgi:hypothetical protein